MHKLRFLVPAIAVFNVVLVFSSFTPSLSDITGFAEAAYINSGRLLLDGVLPPFGYSPLSAFFYALTYLPFQESPYWLIYSCSVGRLFLFGLLWSGAYLVANIFHKTQPNVMDSPLVTMSMLIASPAITTLITHGSHALFAAMSAFALWQVLLFYHTDKTGHLVAASILVGFSILARSGEGSILFGLFAAIVFWLSRGTQGVGRALATATLPVIILTGSYIVIHSKLVGEVDLGMGEYSYFTFEQGHGLAFQSKYDATENFYVAGQMDARRVFGTPEENGYSIKTAILRNPTAYLERIPALFQQVPRYAVQMYGGGIGIVILLFAARGVLELTRNKLYKPLCVLLLWSSYLVIYPLLVYQPTHFLLPFYIVFLLASVGIKAAVGNVYDSREHFLWYVALTGFVLIGIFLPYSSFFPAILLVLLSLAVVWSILSDYRHQAAFRYSGLMLVLVALLVSGNYPPPNLRSANGDSELEATLFLREHLKPSAFVGAYSPKNVWMAKQNYIPLVRTTLPASASDKEFSAWLRDNHVQAIFSDPLLRILEPSIWQMVQNHIGQELAIEFTSKEGKWQVLTSRDVPDADLSSFIDRPWYSSQSRFKPQHN